MLVDNSQFKAFQTCCYLWYEKHIKGIEVDWTKRGVTAADFGTRCHQILEEHYLELKGTPREPYPEYPHEPTELEAQATMAAYRNHYPLDLFRVLDVEKTFRIPLGNRHEYTGKFDVILRDNETGLLSVMDHKTEKRQSHSNNPKAWAARTQGTLYLWAAEQIYGEEFRDLIVNVIRRQSDKGQIGPEFSRQRIQRSREQMELAVQGLIRVADQMEEMKATYTERDWAAAANRNACMVGNFECDFYFPHLEGWSDDLLRQYRPTVPYLDL